MHPQRKTHVFQVSGRVNVTERQWLMSLVLSRSFMTLIFMTYAASLPTLTREWSMTATQAGLVQTAFSAGFAISLFTVSWFSDHIGPRHAG
jgi:MFS family permease